MPRPFDPVDAETKSLRPYYFIFWLTVLVATIFFYARASDPATVWIDEFYTINIIGLEPARIIQETSYDAHPPLYYLLLKCWMKILPYVGFEKDLFLGRLFSFVGVLAGIFLARFQITKILGKPKALVIATLLLMMPVWYDNAEDMRNYTWVIALVLNAGIAFVRLLIERDGETNKVRHRSTLLWLLYTVCFMAAWWMHMIVGLIILWFGLVWVYFSAKEIIISRSAFKNGFLIKGTISHIIILASFYPWIQMMERQLYHLEVADLAWMTPPTVENFFGAIYRTTLIGSDYWSVAKTQETLFDFMALAALGIACGALIKLILKNRKVIHKPAPVFISMLFIWFGSTLTMAMLAAYDFVPLFHASRYPMVISPFVILVFAYCIFDDENEADARKKAFPKPSRLFVLLPIVCVFLVANVKSYQLPPVDIFKQWIEENKEDMPPIGSTVYFAPGHHLKYHDSLLKYYNLIPWSSINSEDIKEGDSVAIIVSIFWQPKKDEGTLAWQMISKSEVRSEGIQFFRNEENYTGMLYAKNLTQGDIDTFGHYVFPTPRIRYPSFPENALRIFTAHDCKPENGWAGIEMDAYRNTYRWASKRTLGLDLDEPLPAGNYEFFMVGFRSDLYKRQSSLKIDFNGDEIWKDLNPGVFNFSVPFEIKEGDGMKEIKFYHDFIKDKSIDEHDQRKGKYYMILNGAWIESVEKI